MKEKLLFFFFVSFFYYYFLLFDRETGWVEVENCFSQCNIVVVVIKVICFYNCGRKIIVKKNVMLVNYVMLVYYVYVRVVCIMFLYKSFI